MSRTGLKLSATAGGVHSEAISEKHHLKSKALLIEKSYGHAVPTGIWLRYRKHNLDKKNLIIIFLNGEDQAPD